MAFFEFKTRVSYDDIGDGMTLSLRGAIGMMQEAAIIHSDMIGYSINDVQRTQVIWMLVQWRVRMVGEAYWNEPLTVVTWPRTMERATSERDFKIIDEHGQPVALGESVWVLVSAQTGRIIRIPSHIKQAYDLTKERAIEDPFEETAQDVPGVLTFSGRVCRRDIDTNHHMNNRVYLDYAFEALPQTVLSSSINEAVIRYRSQLVYGQDFQCVYKNADGVNIVEIVGSDDHTIHASVMLRQR